MTFNHKLLLGGFIFLLNCLISFFISIILAFETNIVDLYDVGNSKLISYLLYGGLWFLIVPSLLLIVEFFFYRLYSKKK